MKLVEVGPMHNGEFHIHRAGCGDLKKGMYRGYEREGRMYLITVEVGEDLAKKVTMDIYPPGDFEYEEKDWERFAGDIRFFPCIPPMPVPEDEFVRKVREGVTEEIERGKSR